MLLKFHRDIRHLKRDKLIDYAKRQIYNPRRDEVEIVLENCKVCQLKVKLHTQQDNIVIKSICPGERYQADLIDLKRYSEQNNGYSWIFNCIDCYSKYLISMPLKNKLAESVSNAFKQIFATFGKPKKLQTDNGKEFVNTRLSNLLKKYKIMYIRGRARHPQTQGQVERVN